MFDIEPLALPDVFLLHPKIYLDERGYFYESYHSRKFEETLGIKYKFKQDSYSFSKKNVLRGLHFQLTRPQAKVVSAIRGKIYDVMVDIRKDSASFGRWVGIILNGDSRKLLYIPEGFAHGFCVLSDYAEIHYKFSEFYDPEDESGIVWDDPSIAIDWPVSSPILSKKDQAHKSFDTLLRQNVFNSN